MHNLYASAKQPVGGQTSSETISEKTFDFTLFNKYHKRIDNKWLEWFIGFTEGDGAILESKGRLYFIITQKDVKVLYHIKDILGFGNVTLNKVLGFGRFIVADNKNLQKLAYLFNGNLILDKRKKQLNLWLNTLNRKGLSAPIELIDNQIELTLDSAWVSGFVDAEGCFNVSIKKRIEYKLGFQTKLRFLLELTL